MGKTRVLVIDDEQLMREYVEEALGRAGYDVRAASSGAAGLELLDKEGFDAVVTDLKMTPMDGLEVLRRVRKEAPGCQCIVMTAYGTIETAVEALKLGAADYLLKPFSPDALEVTLARAIERTRLAQENQYLRAEVNRPFELRAMIGESAAMREVHEQVRKVAASRATVLIRGESGTGKELVARAIHYASPRAHKPFIKVNCAALSAGLLESELFGHEKGAFTGAHERKIGRFELADEGTLLLDEVTEIGLELQPKLLRALQEREFERVGGVHSIRVDTRIVSTTNRNLERAVEEGAFREDLFFRLNVIAITLPPLRDRREDIPPLTQHFIERYCQENGRELLQLDPAVRKQMLAYSWPGNVRELQNALERAVVLSNRPVLGPEHFDFNLGPTLQRGGRGRLAFPRGTTIAEAERALIEQTLEQCNQNRTQAAAVLGISVRTLRNRLAEYALRADG